MTFIVQSLSSVDQSHLKPFEKKPRENQNKMTTKALASTTAFVFAYYAVIVFTSSVHKFEN